MARRVQLKRAFSKLGICSRTQAEKIIRTGAATVNGVVVCDPLRWIDLDVDKVEIVKSKASFVHHFCNKSDLCHTTVVINKPRGYVTTRSDERARKTVYDLLPERFRNQWLFPAGRLDMDSEGLLIMTNDGQLAHRLTEPSNHIPKTYRVLLNRIPTKEQLKVLCSGIELDNTPTLPCTIVQDKGYWFIVTLYEGRNRQIRRMFHKIGCRVKRLIRIAIGNLYFPKLLSGECRQMDQKEIRRLLCCDPINTTKISRSG